MKNLPGFDWTGGHAGRVLPEELADKLLELWRDYVQELSDEGKLDGERAASIDWDRFYYRAVIV